MTEEYRVPDGMVGLSECGSLWGAHCPSSRDSSWELLPAQSFGRWGLPDSALTWPFRSGQGTTRRAAP